MCARVFASSSQIPGPVSDCGHWIGTVHVGANVDRDRLMLDTQWSSDKISFRMNVLWNGYKADKGTGSSGHVMSTRSCGKWTWIQINLVHWTSDWRTGSDNVRGKERPSGWCINTSRMRFSETKVNSRKVRKQCCSAGFWLQFVLVQPNCMLYCSYIKCTSCAECSYIDYEATFNDAHRNSFNR